MNRTLTHRLVGLVTAILLAAAVVFSLPRPAPAGPDQAKAPSRPALPRVGHPVDAGMADCAKCHTARLAPAPRNHATFAETTCLTCHRVAAAGAAKRASEGEAGRVPHAVSAPYDDCTACHAIGKNLSMPADHSDYENDGCLDCHETKAAAGS